MIHKQADMLAVHGDLTPRMLTTRFAALQAPPAVQPQQALQVCRRRPYLRCRTAYCCTAAAKCCWLNSGHSTSKKHSSVYALSNSMKLLSRCSPLVRMVRSGGPTADVTSEEERCWDMSSGVICAAPAAPQGQVQYHALAAHRPVLMASIMHVRANHGMSRGLGSMQGSAGTALQHLADVAG